MAKWRCCCDDGDAPPFDAPCGSLIRETLATYYFCQPNEQSVRAFAVISPVGPVWFRSRRIFRGDLIGESIDGFVATNTGGGFFNANQAIDEVVNYFGIQSWPRPTMTLPGPSIGGVTSLWFQAQNGDRGYVDYLRNSPNPFNPTSPNIDEIRIVLGTPVCGPAGVVIENTPNPYPDAQAGFGGLEWVIPDPPNAEFDRRGVWGHRFGYFLPSQFVSPCPNAQAGTENDLNTQIIEAFSMSDPVRRCRGCGG